MIFTKLQPFSITIIFGTSIRTLIIYLLDVNKLIYKSRNRLRHRKQIKGYQKGKGVGIN